MLSAVHVVEVVILDRAPPRGAPACKGLDAGRGALKHLRLAEVRCSLDHRAVVFAVGLRLAVEWARLGDAQGVELRLREAARGRPLLRQRGAHWTQLHRLLRLGYVPRDYAPSSLASSSASFIAAAFSAAALSAAAFSAASFTIFFHIYKYEKIKYSSL